MVNFNPHRPNSPRPSTPHTKVEEELHEMAGIDYDKVSIHRNPSVAVLYEEALTHEYGTVISSAGALCAYSGKKTGRSPKDKRIVDEETSNEDIWWGPVNTKMSERVFLINRERAIDYLNTRPRLYVFDGYAGWDPKYRKKIRVVASRAYHILFMRNMLIRPTEEELEDFGTPDFTIFNAGEFPANRYTTGMTSTTSVAVNFKVLFLTMLSQFIVIRRTIFYSSFCLFISVVKWSFLVLNTLVKWRRV